MSADGERVAVLLPIPTYTDLGAAWVEREAWSFAIVMVEGGRIETEIELLTQRDLMREREGLTDCCLPDDEICSPDSCVPDMELSEQLEADFRAEVSQRLSRARERLVAEEWHPLVPASQRGGQLAVEIDENTERASVRLIRRGAALVSETVELACPNCTEVDGVAFIHPTEPWGMVRVTSTNLDRTAQGSRFLFGRAPAAAQP